jgi:RNA polymerase sigma factor (sigma-70 family)
MKRASTCPASDLGRADDRGYDLDGLYRRERPYLIRFFARNRAAGPDAEDLAQEAFLRMARAGQDVDGIARPVAYLRQIGRNLLKDRANSAAHRNATVELDAENAASEQNELRRLEARDSLRRLEAAMYLLKPRTRHVFLAHRLDGFSYAEIAQHMGLSVKRVEKIMAEAISELADILDRDR